MRGRHGGRGGAARPGFRPARYVMQWIVVEIKVSAWVLKEYVGSLRIVGWLFLFGAVLFRNLSPAWMEGGLNRGRHFDPSQTILL